VKREGDGKKVKGRRGKDEEKGFIISFSLGPPKL